MKARQETSLFKESAIKQGIGKAQLLADVITQSMGMFRTVQVDKNGGMIIYLHDKANLYESTVVWKISSAGFFVSTDGMRTWNAGITPEGDVAVNVLSAVGINFDWARGGTLTLGGKENGHGVLQVLNENDGNVFSVNNEGIIAGETTLANKTGVRTCLLFNQDYNGLVVGFSEIGGGVVKDPNYNEWDYIGGFADMNAYIPSNFTIEDARMLATVAAGRNFWENFDTGHSGYETGQAKHIKITYLNESEIIKDLQTPTGENPDDGTEFDIEGTIIPDTGDFDGTKSGPSSLGTTIKLISGNLKDYITSGETHYFNIVADIYKGSMTDAGYKTATQYCGYIRTTLWVSGYYK